MIILSVLLDKVAYSMSSAWNQFDIYKNFCRYKTLFIKHRLETVKNKIEAANRYPRNNNT